MKPALHGLHQAQNMCCPITKCANVIYNLFLRRNSLIQCLWQPIKDIVNLPIYYGYIAVTGTSIVINIQRSSCHCCRLYKTSVIYRSISEQLLLCGLLIAFWSLQNKGEFPYVQLISCVDLVSQMDLSFNFHVSLYAQKPAQKRNGCPFPQTLWG